MPRIGGQVVGAHQPGKDPRQSFVRNRARPAPGCLYTACNLYRQAAKAQAVLIGSSGSGSYGAF
ncbi:MAG TPA: hypothetical protein VMJ75_11560 [Candidatus Acidoferrales bacterium]|nr:hypothetical protein [Candidatus Acidoferrales bacterium]